MSTASTTRSAYYANYKLKTSTATKAPAKKRLAIAASVTMLFLAIGCPFFCFSGKSNSHQIANVWPTNSELCKATDTKTVLLFADIGDDSATSDIEALDKLLKTENALATVVLRQNPSVEHKDSILFAQAQKVEGLNVVLDSGNEHDKFGVSDSRVLVMYDRDGELVYKGTVEHQSQTKTRTTLASSKKRLAMAGPMN